MGGWVWCGVVQGRGGCTSVMVGACRMASGWGESRFPGTGSALDPAGCMGVHKGGNGVLPGRSLDPDLCPDTCRQAVPLTVEDAAQLMGRSSTHLDSIVR